jgi:membrane dipeptidase
MPERQTVSRRQMLAGSAMAAVGFPLINRASFAFAAAPDRSYSARAIKLVQESLVIDMLAPLSLNLEPTVFDKPFTDEQKAQFRTSGITGFHNSYGLGGFSAKQDAFEYLAAWNGFVGAQSDLFALVRGVSDLDAAKAARKVAVIMGIQNADQFQVPEDVAQFYRLGLRCAQLTYNSQNFIGSGSTDRVDGGVSDFGAQIIAAMNKAGMLIDVSHCGDRTTLDGIGISAKAIAITHSNCRAITPHPRTKTDAAIRALAKKGGVMGITGVRNFVRDRDPTTVAHMVDHIDHVVKLAGIEHVGIGSDADLNGYDDMDPKQYAELKAAYKSSYAFRGKLDIDGFDHPRKVFDLTEELIRRRYSDDNIRLILGGNFRRLLGATWH